MTTFDLYLRKSSSDKRRSVKRQETDLRDDLAGEGITPGRVFVDPDLSASVFANKPRPGYTELTGHIRTGACQGVALWEASRGSRTAGQWLDFLELCKTHATLIRIQSHGRTYDPSRRRDWRTLADDGVNAHDESLELSDRVCDGKRDAARNGLPAGRLLYGYRRVYDERGHYVQQVEHPEQAGIVRDVYSRVARRESLSSVGRRYGWRYERVSKLIRNPGYRGLRVHQGAVVGAAAWPALVGQDLWTAANAVLDDPGRKPATGTVMRAILAGVARCGRPGCAGTLRSAGLGTAGERRYACRVCRKVSIAADPLDDFVERAVLDQLRKPDMAALFAPRSDDAALVAARRQEKALRDELALDYANRAAGVLSAPGLVAVETAMLPRIERAAALVARLSTPPVLRDLAGVDIPARWHTFTPRRKRDIIAVLVDLVVDPAVPGRRGFDPWRLARSRWTGDTLTWGQHWTADSLTDFS